MQDYSCFDSHKGMKLSAKIVCVLFSSAQRNGKSDMHCEQDLNP